MRRRTWRGWSPGARVRQTRRRRGPLATIGTVPVAGTGEAKSWDAGTSGRASCPSWLCLPLRPPYAVERNDAMNPPRSAAGRVDSRRVHRPPPAARRRRPPRGDELAALVPGHRAAADRDRRPPELAGGRGRDFVHPDPGAADRDPAGDRPARRRDRLPAAGSAAAPPRGAASRGRLMDRRVDAGRAVRESFRIYADDAAALITFAAAA